MTTPIRPRWEWALHDDAGARLPEPVTPVFTSRFDAEQWLGEHWRSLTEAGATAAQLHHDGEPTGPRVDFLTP
ncbi:hypothetical protein [Myceligenerans pegani]|uniref:Uncharacterized protein n=1 Tax=Myceligenerans pegani TaxID=2776917 RepID=A0ABR9N0Y1_9MICO|nr:hypothetical protein [Myceligenerans sp. TRM 65318]MBE1877000.1 hypothetical protein [Myceligenerans sp. TRM 65318]MBE3019271.1 hypothetical protein [Myceligenerans sp. TRM 65318]